jgi:hypothetical protein
MNQKSFIMAAILAVTVVTAIATPLAYADESTTDTDQEIKQKNVGSGRAEQNNCAFNGIDHSDADNNCNNNN